MNPIRSFHGRARNAWRASLLAGLTCASALAVAACGASVATTPAGVWAGRTSLARQGVGKTITKPQNAMIRPNRREDKSRSISHLAVCEG